MVAIVDPSNLRSLAFAGAVIGLFAGLAGGAVASVTAEPSIDAAIAIEARSTLVESDVHAVGDGAVVGRAVQSGVGLFGAYGLSGAAFGGLVALLAFFLGRGQGSLAKGVGLAGTVLAGAITIAPWFKYPPNPPAVGSPSTLADRQRLYSMIIIIALSSALAAIALGRRLRASGWSGSNCLAIAAVTLATPMGAAYAAMPPATDPIDLPARLVWQFRVASLGANLTLWAVLTLTLACVVSAATERRCPSPGTRLSRDEPAVLL